MVFSFCAVLRCLKLLDKNGMNIAYLANTVTKILFVSPPCEYDTELCEGISVSSSLSMVESVEWVEFFTNFQAHFNCKISLCVSYRFCFYDLLVLIAYNIKNLINNQIF